ncbi:TetR family transcriptional regulator [Acuticoccus sp. M5D2P5]|uniref:TetR/AcrR family transcriptional regulator n=1 Tax=Acuticoccus kalidii TaxID=2910977 RepID=UPI001F302351|nr:TetR/AcrR family transcriptional regulator [Acuticoccus kalidii]MCF3936132.1 TetR family transcriptional regulator [Acuticoccus kalidii]
MHAPVRQAKAKSRPAQRDAERSRAAILAAATAEFTAHGFGGASVNEVAARAAINKRMIYHYYGNKEGLFLAVLEETYARIRSAESELCLAHLAPPEAVRRLVLFTFDYFVKNPEFLTLLNTENMLHARHLKRSEQIQEMHSPLVGTLAELLKRGAADGVFREDVDPVQLYISIAALGFFYMANNPTLSTIFGRNLATPEALETRREHIASVIMDYLRP